MELVDRHLMARLWNVTLSNINREPKKLPKNWAVVNQDFNTDSWVYLLVSSHSMPVNDRAFPAVAHPIHLHGHDFAILQQSSTQYKVGGLNLKLDNPPRRNVALLPKNGFLVIAFKADNPGSWLMHYHIVWHASGGAGAADFGKSVEDQAQSRGLY
jgi:hypothetical protein